MLPVRKRNTLLIFIGFAAVFCYLRVPHKNKSNVYESHLARSTKLHIKQKHTFFNPVCINFLKKLSSHGFEGIIVDFEFFKKMSSNKTTCNVNYLKIAALDSKNRKHRVADYTNLTIHVLRFENATNKDYWLFNVNGIQRAIPKMPLRNISHFYYPEDSDLFKEYWYRSRLLECLNLNMNRTNTTRVMPLPESFKQMASLRELQTSYGMFPFLVSGSLLGWYRECSIIPHTRDVDLAVFIDQFNPEFEEDTLNEKTDFTMSRKLGMVNDSFEYTVVHTNTPVASIDIFFVYKEENMHWFGGTGNDGSKYRFNYPRFDVQCTADLGGFLFWVPCDPVALLEAEYGTEWRQDHPTSNYTWNKSGKNARMVGKWAHEVLDQVVVHYRKSFWQNLFNW